MGLDGTLQTDTPGLMVQPSPRFNMRSYRDKEECHQVGKCLLSEMENI